MLRREKCPVCSSRKLGSLYCESYRSEPLRNYLRQMYASSTDLDFAAVADAEYELCQCAGCGFCFQLQIPEPQLMVQLYEQWIDPAAARAIDAQRRATVYGDQCAELTVLLDELGVPADLSVLDFGMGWGNWCQLARGFGCATYGAELSTARLEHARHTGIGTNIAGRQFDLIHADQVLEHLADPAEKLQELASQLKPGGLLHVNVPDCRSLHRRLARFDWAAPTGTRRSLQIASPMEHINCFTHHTLVRLGQQCGLRLDRSRTRRLLRATRSGWKKWRKRMGTNVVFAC